MIATQFVTCNMVPSGTPPVVYMSQYDVGRPIGVAVHASGGAVDLNPYVVTIEATRTDGTAITADVTTDGNEGTFTTTAVMTNKTDKYPAQLVIVDGDGNRVASIPLIFIVIRASMDENAESIEEDASLYQQYTGTVQGLIASERRQRLNADNILQTNLNQAETSLWQGITTEQNTRSDADTALGSLINAEASVRSTQDTVLQAEIDQFVAPTGSAPSEAEVLNARVGADGVTYNTLGNAIRTQASDLKNAIIGSEAISTNVSPWEVGSLSASNGGNLTSNTRIRTAQYKTVENISHISVESGYKFAILVYTGTSMDAYVGEYNGSALTTTATWFEKDAWLWNVDRSYKYRIVLAKTDDSTIDTFAGANLHIYTYTDRSLSKTGVPADAKVTGDLVRELQESSIYSGISPLKTSVLNQEWYISAGNWINGLRSAVIPVNPGDAVDIIANADHNQSIAFLKTFDTSVTAVDFSAAEGWTGLYYLTKNTRLSTTVPADTHYLYVYLNNNNIWMPQSVAINGYDFAKSIFGNVTDVSKVINRYNSDSVKLYDDTVEETTVNGITYSITGGVVILSGTATANTFIVFEGSASMVPLWVRDGRYYAKVTRAVMDAVKYQLTKYRTGQGTQTFCSTYESTWFDVANVSDYDGVISRLMIPKGATVDNVIQVEILSAIPNTDVVIPKPSQVVKIRMMQYNPGHFNMGQSLSGSYHYLTSANFDNILNKYKQLLGDIQPDVIGMEEFEDTVTVYGVDGADDVTVSMNSLLFDRLYPYGDTSGTLSKRSIKSKYPLRTTKHKTLYYNYTYGGTDYSGEFYVIYSHIEVGGKYIGIVVNAFANSNEAYSDEQNLIMKEACYSSAVELLENDDIAFIVCDANASPDAMTSIMNDVLIPAGYNSAHGSYFPWQDTWESINTGRRNAIDNIFYKENSGNVQLMNFKVLWDWRADLASDHAPVYADFLIL